MLRSKDKKPNCLDVFHFHFSWTHIISFGLVLIDICWVLQEVRFFFFFFFFLLDCFFWNLGFDWLSRVWKVKQFVLVEMCIDLQRWYELFPCQVSCYLFGFILFYFVTFASGEFEFYWVALGLKQKRFGGKQKWL